MKKPSASSYDCDPVCLIAVSSPIGDIEIHSCKDGLHSVKQCALDDTTFNPNESCRVEIKSQSGSMSDQAYGHASQCIEWLKDYFTKSVAHIEIPPLCPAITSNSFFRARAWSLLPSAAPFGVRITYAQLAQLCGNRQASRAAGQAMALNPVSLLIPCHRVIPSHGGIGNYHHGKKNLIKSWLLDFEQRKQGI